MARRRWLQLAKRSAHGSTGAVLGQCGFGEDHGNLKICVAAE